MTNAYYFLFGVISIWISDTTINTIRSIRQNCIFEYKETRAHWLILVWSVKLADAMTVHSKQWVNGFIVFNNV